MRSVLLYLGVGLHLCAACTPTPPPEEASPGHDHLARSSSLLTLPPVSGTPEALRDLERAARQGSCVATWLEARYLLDLFDLTRLGGGWGPDTLTAGAHGLLWRQLGLSGPPGRGGRATRQVLDGLKRRFAAIAPVCPEAEAARLAMRMLHVDSSDRDNIESALAAVVLYKKIARSSVPLGPSAMLRLTDWCDKAFNLAAGGDPALQHRRLNQCLFSLFDADPTPYFEVDPEHRPTDPPWTVLADALERRYEALSSTRFARLSRALERRFESFRRLATSRLPTAISLASTPIPTSDAGAAWDRTPVVLITRGGYLVGGKAILSGNPDDLVNALTRRLHNDRRGRITVTAAAAAPLSMLMEVARAARRAGASILELGVMKRVAARSPAGDVQAALFGQGPVFRLEVIPLSLLLFSTQAPLTPSREHPHGLGDDPRRAENQLAIRFSGVSLAISTRHGILPPCAASSLKSTLARLRKYYPDDEAIILVPGPGASYRDLIKLAERLRGWRQEGLTYGVALATAGHLPPPEADLNTSIKLWERARVTASPGISSDLLVDLRECYRAALRLIPAGDPLPGGALTLRQSKAGYRRAGGSLKDNHLHACALSRVEAMPAPRPPRVEISFSLATE